MRRALLTVLLSAVAWSAATASAGTPQGTFDGCPQHVLPPPAAYAPTARGVTLRFLATTYGQVAKVPSSQLVGAKTMGVLLVRHWLPSGWIKSECGFAVWDRSVAVNVYFPALDLPHNPIGRCNDCDRVVLLAAKTTSGWTVWGIY